MDRRIYDQMAEHEDSHWWFRGRRALVSRVIRRCCELPPRPRILDAGCGTGGNLAMLAEHGSVVGFEMDGEAAGIARARGVAEVRVGRLPDVARSNGERFDLVVMTDVLEHIDDDAGALRAVPNLLEPGGWLVLTVPALQWLWSKHDQTHHHFRRYNRSGLSRLLTDAGYLVRWLSYHNSWLFPVVAGVRLCQKMLGVESASDDVRALPVSVNELLYTVFARERHFVGRASLPIGVSLLACAQLPES